MHTIVVVGAGDYYTRILEPSLTQLATNQDISIAAIVDIRQESPKKKVFFSDVPYIVREKEQPLSTVLQSLQADAVLLGHVNYLHTPDAIDLLKHGYTVLLEKPYAISQDQLDELCAVADTSAGTIIPLEYYLTMKSIPLLLLAGLVKPDSFYVSEPGILSYTKKEKVVRKLFGGLYKLIGTPKKVEVEVLEGEGDVGKVDHRGSHLTDMRFGGGMLQDLGVHALAPLAALDACIGKIDSQRISVKTAHADSYVAFAKKQFELKLSTIGESYAEIFCQTDIGIPCVIRVGKYVLPNQNRRGIRITGDIGEVYMDLSTCTVFVQQFGKENEALFSIPKKSESKYYPVLRSVYEIMQGNSPYMFDMRQAAFTAQEVVLQAVSQSKGNPVHIYKAGELPKNIF